MTHACGMGHICSNWQKLSKKECAWVQMIKDAVRRIVKRFPYGKSNEHFVSAAIETALKLVGSFYGGTFLGAIITNISIFIAALEHQSKRTTRRQNGGS